MTTPQKQVELKQFFLLATCMLSQDTDTSTLLSITIADSTKPPITNHSTRCFPKSMLHPLNYLLTHARCLITDGSSPECAQRCEEQVVPPPPTAHPSMKWTLITMSAYAAVAASTFRSIMVESQCSEHDIELYALNQMLHKQSS